MPNDPDKQQVITPTCPAPPDSTVHLSLFPLPAVTDEGFLMPPLAAYAVPFFIIPSVPIFIFGTLAPPFDNWSLTLNVYGTDGIGADLFIVESTTGHQYTASQATNPWCRSPYNAGLSPPADPPTTVLFASSP